MCVSPIIRPNPLFGKKHVGLNFLKDTEHSHVAVPCGHCYECVAQKQGDMVQRVANEAEYSYLYFCTLTYDNKHLPRLRVEFPESESLDTVESNSDASFNPSDEELEALLEDASDDLPNLITSDKASRRALVRKINDESNPVLEVESLPNYSLESVDGSTQQSCDAGKTPLKSVEMPYADIHHVQLLLKNLRDNNPCPGRRIRYLACSELGKTRARPHFHILFFIERLPDDDKFTPLRLERPLHDYIMQHWAVNIGTRKNPVWEPRFTYRKRFYGGKLYQNYDLHYVNPNYTTDGVSNVAFYVTKYMMKPSAKEEARKRFLKLNLPKESYEQIWKTIKCRLLISKGLGLDVSFETVETPVYEYVPLALDSYAREFEKALSSDDLPEDDIELGKTRQVVVEIKKRRLMVPNFDLVTRIRQMSLSGLRAPKPEEVRPLWIDINGHHHPLAVYYKRYSLTYTVRDALDFWFNGNDIDVPKSPEFIDKRIEKFHKQQETIDSHGDFDLLSTAMESALFSDSPVDNIATHRFRNVTNTTVYRLGIDKL